MNDEVRDVIDRAAAASHDGSAAFGQIVQTLMAAGVERYHADYCTGTTTYYLPDGATRQVPLAAPTVPIPDGFDAAGLLDAIRSAQRGEIRYPRFVERSRAAGCVGYVAWLDGRQVTYFGRRGQTHVERFPD